MFDTSLRDSQSTAVNVVNPENFDFDQYAEYAAKQDAKVRAFMQKDSGVLVYRRFRVAEVYGWECQDRELSLRLQLGALKESMKYTADMANYLEPWYGIGIGASAFGAKYIWLDGQAPAVSDQFESIEEALAYDENLTGIRDMLYDLDSLAEDLRRALSEYLEDQTFDEEEFREVTGRLDLIRNLEQKYGRTVDDVLLALEEKKNRLEVLSHFDEIREKTQKEYRESEEKLRKLCESLTAERKKTAKVLAEKIREKLLDLNFLDVRFEMAFEELPHFTSDGLDAAEFMISANPGEPVRPLAMAASGGELSRIMLAIKTVLAETDEIPTLIFDEIDTGISGRTAQKVSEQLGIIAGKHQVICITHLPQIAAMADRHFEIRKDAVGERTVTSIRELTHDEMCGELARLLGGAEITEAVLQNAREMKALADREKAAHRG